MIKRIKVKILIGILKIVVKLAYLCERALDWPMAYFEKHGENDEKTTGQIWKLAAYYVFIIAPIWTIENVLQFICNKIAQKI